MCLIFLLHPCDDKKRLIDISLFVTICPTTGRSSSFQRTWVGLTNPGTVACQGVSGGSSCSNEVFWADGEVFLPERLPELDWVTFNSKIFSAAHRNDNNNIENLVGSKAYVLPYICEINCAIGDIYLGGDL